MSQANRIGGGVIVMYVDLDRFKAINDSFGHAAGDAVLKHTGERIRQTLRAGDTASRVGGDEFIVVCATSAPANDVDPIAARLLAALTAPIDVAGETFVVEASIGISVYPADGHEADTLIRKADAAMYLAKQHGRNTFRRFGNEALASVVAATQFESELRHAIAANQLVVYYQPIVDLRTGRPRAAEALVRWQHPQRGLLAPDEFIAFAEERGLIGQIGGVVLETACETLAWLKRSGHPTIKIGVNVSAHQFGAPGFIDSIVEALQRHQIEPRLLAVEITESVVMGNTIATLATLDALDALGVSLSIDDFGTGYSSLAYIKRFPITTLKIDRSFVQDISEDKTDQAIAKTIITLAHSLGMRVVAEGVETHAQLAILAELDVDSVQGYFFSRPLGLPEFQRYIETFSASNVSVLPPQLQRTASAAV
jgi:diguanylate cyclase (GGDEF)-like protein